MYCSRKYKKTFLRDVLEFLKPMDDAKELIELGRKVKRKLKNE